MAGRQASGPETYELNLVREIARRDRENEYCVFCSSRAAVKSFGIQQPNVRFVVLWPPVRWLNIPISLPLSMLHHRLDVLHATMVPPPRSPVEYVFTHHCSSTFVHPEFYPPKMLRRLNFFIKAGLRKARLVLCVSENVRALTAERFNVPPERLAVVYHGVDPAFRPMAADEARRRVQADFGLAGPYILFVGKIEQRKNIVRLLEAYHRLREHDPGVRLVLAGRPTWDRRFLDDAVTRLRLQNAVVELGHLGQEALPPLYCAAEMFVFPSLWEGFGLPVLEAMACGTPVITSNVSSLPEIAGDAAVLVDPNAVDDLAAAMYSLRTDAALRRTLRERGLVRAAAFTWRRTAEQTIDAYRRVADG